ncbi:MFS family permease [Kitasatospora sp. MAA4]|uniref:MFS transporter n=1 Tax=Kitasatospora sp. MAA4 TaxID=3035093 RepID=UPI0024733B54|nr:MFS transporter [Kitasatospora sp. MAA4]MDH6132187.1 MFS family permease [Kitasatospora sp. MAA4]
MSGALGRRPLVGVLAAEAVSLTGTRVSAVALPWFVLVTTGSATQTGVVAFCEMAPYVVVKAFTGPLVDRIGPRVISWATDSVSAVAAGLVPLLYAMHLLAFWSLLVLVAVVGAVRGPGDLAKHVMVPEAAERSGVPLERATGLAGVTERLASTVGPLAGGSLVALTGPMAGLVVNAVSFALGSVIIAVALPRGMGRAAAPETDGAPGQGYWRSFGEGFGFLRGEPLLLAITVMVGATNLLDAAFSSVLLPFWVRSHGHGPALIGLLGSVGGISAVCGSLIAAAVAHRLRRRPVFFVGFLLAGAPRFLALALHAPLWAVLAVFLASGFGGGFLNPIIGAVVYERIPRRLLGRVGALGDALAWAGIPVGGLLAGLAVASFGLVPVLLAGGACYFVITNLTGLRPEWRMMGRAADDVPAPVPLSADDVPEPVPPAAARTLAG